MHHARPFFLVAALALSFGCPASTPPQPDELDVELTRGNCDLKKAEEILGTSDGAHYHAVVPNSRRIPMVATSFLVGIEKAPRRKLHVPKSKDRYLTLDGLSDSVRPFAKALLANPKRTFVSHLVEYEVIQSTKRFTRVRSRFAYSAYDDTCRPPATPSEAPSSLYAKSWRAVGETLGARLDDVLRKARDAGTPFTHVILMSTGWNTYQRTSIEKYNTWTTHLLDLAGDKPFHPLVIGFSWNSRWWLPGVSLVNKAKDADELGWTWVRRTLATVAGLKKKHGFRLALIGHSLGARLLARATFSPSIVKNATLAAGDVDLFVGLQGALPIQCFFGDKGHEHCDYRANLPIARQTLLTSSRLDSAMGAAILAPILMRAPTGGLEARDLVRNKGLPLWTVDRQGRVIKRSGTVESTVVHVDADRLITNEVRDHGGGAHNDVFKRTVAAFMLDALLSGGPAGAP